MRILHIWDQAGVSCIFAKYQRLHGHDSRVITITGNDKYGIYRYYKDYVISATPRDFIELSLKEAEKSDIIHVHGIIDIVFRLRRRYGRSKIIILEYLGTDIRGLEPPELAPGGPSLVAMIADSLVRKLRRKDLSKRQLHFYAQILADAVLVSTPDLLPLVHKGRYLQIPVDLEHFKSIATSAKKALTIKTEAIDVERALSYCKKNGVFLDIEVHDRIMSPIMYADMPTFLRRYNVYVDIRFVRTTLLANMSSTALQALACGLEVLDHNLEFRSKFPMEHDPNRVVSGLDEIYSREIEKKVRLWQMLIAVNRWFSRKRKLWV